MCNAVAPADPRLDGSRCTGHCCRNFHLPFSPDQIQATARHHHEVCVPTGLGAPGRPCSCPHDVEVVADMVVYLGAGSRANLRGADAIGVAGMTGHRYTCRHLQANGDCGIYARRPRVCSGYPWYGGRGRRECEWPGCTDACARRGVTLGSDALEAIRIAILAEVK